MWYLILLIHVQFGNKINSCNVVKFYTLCTYIERFIYFLCN